MSTERRLMLVEVQAGQLAEVCVVVLPGGAGRTRQQGLFDVIETGKKMFTTVGISAGPQDCHEARFRGIAVAMKAG